MSSYIPTNFAGGILNYNSNDFIKHAETVFVNETGDTMKGNLNMNGNKILNVAPSENGEDPVIKKDLLNQFLHFELKFSKKIIDQLKNIEIPTIVIKIFKDFEIDKTQG